MQKTNTFKKINKSTAKKKKTNAQPEQTQQHPSRAQNGTHVFRRGKFFSPTYLLVREYEIFEIN
jgi:hypothetical protein